MTRDVTGSLVAMAWIYVAMRVLHSLIHVTYNKILHRFSIFALSNLLLLAMWIMFALDEYRQT